MSEDTRIIRVIVDSSRAVEGSAAATRALERMERAQGQAVSSLDRLEKSMGRVGGYLKAQLALIVADIAARLFQMGKQAFDAAAGMGELAEQLGVTTTGLQALQYSAAQNGLKIEALETSVMKFNQKMGEAADGSKPMIEALDAIGVKILDFNGNLRPTETLMSEVAAAILAIDDPARRAAASVEFFGKSGSRMQPMLNDIAKGFDSMGAAAERGSAVMSENTIARLDQISDSMARSAQKWKATMANLMVDTLEDIEKRLARINIGFSDAQWDKGFATIKRWSNEISDFLGNGLRTALDETALAGGRFVVSFLAYFENLPKDLPKLFIDALNASIEAVEGGLNIIGGKIAAEFPWLAGKAGISGTAVQFGRIDGGGASTAADRFSAAGKAGDDWEAGKRAEFATTYAQQKEVRDRAALIARQAGMSNDEDNARRGKLGPVSAGARNPLPKGGGGDSVGDKINKALGDSARELESAKAFADAATQGAEAVANLEIHFKALKTAQDAFGKTADENTRGVADLTAKLEEQALATQKLKNLGDFRVGTQALRDQNELLAAEVRLANELPDIRARELATLKVMQEVRAKGLTDNKQDIEDRLAVMEMNENLKRQAEDMKRATELWTEPLKTALSSIQTTAADAFEGMLNSGKFNMEELGQVFKKMVVRMAAEFMALATVRPVMSVLVNTVSPGMANTLGLGGGNSAMSPFGGGGGGGGLFGGMSMPSMNGGVGLYGEALESSSSGGSGFFSGVGSMFSSAGSFLQQPMSSLFSSGAPAGGYADVGALLASGNTSASASASGIGGVGGMSIGAGIGSAIGIGMGAYQALTSKSLGGTLGGIGTMIGSGMMLIPGMQIPGMIVSALSAILPSIIGEPDTRTHSSTNASLRYGSGSWYTTGGAYGANANSGQSESALRGITAGIDSVFGLMGGVKDASKVWGLNLNSWTAQGKDWSYTSRDTSLVDPATGQQEAWRMNMDNMMDTGAAQVAIRSILGGAVGEITETMKTALKSMSAANMGIEETGKSIMFVDETYERLGKGALTVRSQFRELESQFSEMTETAKKLGLSLEPIQNEQKKATERLGRDYIDNLIDPIAVGLRAWEDERASILANVDYISQHTDVVVDMARINTALLRKEAALKEELYGGAISQLEDAIKRLLPGGNLANVDPSGTLAGMRATYQATYAQAASGDAAAIGRFGSEATAYAEYAQGYFAGSPEYNAIKLQIIEALQTVQSSVLGPSAPAQSEATTAATNANTAQMQQLLASFQNLMDELRDQKAQNAKLTAVLSRYVTTQAA